MDWEVAGKDKGAGESSPSPVPPKRKGKKMKKWVIVVALLAILVVYFNARSCIKNQPKNLSWPTTGLATMLPDPPTKKGEVRTNSDERFDADVAKCSEDQFNAYVESCKEKGFTVDAESNSGRYSAYTDEGYKLELYYWSSNETLSIDLDAPIDMGTLAWPTTGAGSNAPAPASAKGKVDSESSTRFVAYVGDTDPAAYSTYVDSCIAAGYSVDYHKGDTSFYGDRSDGAHLAVDYLGFNTMRVTVDTSKIGQTSQDSTAEEAPAESTETTSDDSSSSSNTADFRQFVDDYESFMNSYCDFMEKYSNSSDTTSMLVDYAKYMKEYTEWAAKYDEYDTSDLSADDLAYYTAANARVAERLSKIQ